MFVLSCKPKTEFIHPEVKNITESVYASGFIKSNNQYGVFGRTNGVIEKVFVTEGMRVKKGDIIFQLDNRNFKLATENARLASKASDYKINADKLNDAKKSVDLASKKLANDSLLFSRQKALWNQNIGSKVELEQKELNFENSKSAWKVSRTTYEDLKRQLKLVSEQSKNNLEIAKLMEDDYIIRSAVDGVVYKINKKKGEQINGSDAAAIIGTDEFIIELNIDEFDIIKINKGQQVIIRMDSYKSQVFEAKIISIDPIMNIRIRSFQAEATFTKKPETLYPNLSVEANIVVNSKLNVLTIPRNYLLNDTTVILKGGKNQKVELGLADYDLVEVKDGLDKNSEIEIPQK